MWERRTDLALEAEELRRGEASALPGVERREERVAGYSCTTVYITSPEGARALGKPRGVYHTLDLGSLSQPQAGARERGIEAVRTLLGPLLPPGKGAVLVVGLGNRALTADAVGPLTAEGVLVTRHLVELAPESFGGFCPVAAVTPGVLGTTGVESGEQVKALCEGLRPRAVVAVDALCARQVERLCATVQIGDTGIVPGSGVGNHRMALDWESLGVPVIAVGVPTVVEGATLCADLLEEAGERVPEALPGGNLFVTPRDIDERVKEMAWVLARGISLALQPQLTPEELNSLLE